MYAITSGLDALGESIALLAIMLVFIAIFIVPMILAITIGVCGMWYAESWQQGVGMLAIFVLGLIGISGLVKDIMSDFFGY